eukprot:351638-Chlamydomonas_euryale.AAC.1
MPAWRSAHRPGRLSDGGCLHGCLPGGAHTAQDACLTVAACMDGGMRVHRTDAHASCSPPCVDTWLSRGW